MPYKDPQRRKAHDAARYVAQREEVKARSAARYAGHREEAKAYNAEYYRQNWEEHQAYGAAYHKVHGAAYYKAHCEERKAASRADYAEHREQRLTKGRIWRAANPDLTILYQERRRARKAGLPENFTRAEWEAVKAAYRHQCAYCGKKFERLTQDHVVPVIKGGGTIMGNIVPACGPCNSKKGSNLAANPVQLVLI